MLYEGTILGGLYHVIKEIGRGGAGIVYLAYHERLEKYVVLKNARLTHLDMPYLRNEVDKLKHLHHENLPQVYDFLLVGEDIYTVIDFIDGQDFDKMVELGGRFDEEQLVTYMLELAEVLAYLHGQQPTLLHSDIKPGNIMLRKDGTICLIDFNISIWCDESSTLYGYSKYYTSPEQIRLAMEKENHQPITVQLDGRSDIFSLGATMYYIMTGVKPGEDGVLYPLSMLKTEYSSGLVKIVQKCMEIDPADRFQSAQELSGALKKHLRQGSTFRRKCVAQAAIVCGCGLIICAGIWSLVFGLRQQRHDDFLNQIQVVRQAADDGDSSSVVAQGITILNQYDDQKAQSPDTWLQLLQAVGDSYVALAEDAESGDYRESALTRAIKCYEDAILFASEYDAEQVTECMNRWFAAQLLCETGTWVNESTAFEACLTEQQRQLLNGMRNIKMGDDTLLRRVAQQEITETNREVVCSACVVLAITYESQSELLKQIYYLTAAYKITPSLELEKQLAEGYMKAGELYQNKEYYQQASRLYEHMIENGSDTLGVRLGYVIALRASGDFAEASVAVDALREDYPENFDVLAQSALIYSLLEQTDEAISFAKKAMATVPENVNQNIWSALSQIVQD